MFEKDVEWKDRGRNAENNFHGQWEYHLEMLSGLVIITIW